LIEDCTGCKLFISGVLGGLQIRNCSDCKIVVMEQVTGSVMAFSCYNVEFSLSAHQLRVHDSKKCLFRIVHVQTTPIIEHCTALTFAMLAHNNGNNKEIQDFDWLRTDVPSPNFTIVSFAKQ